MRTKLNLLEEQLFEENDSKDLPPSDIVAFNELRSCADLYRMYKQGILQIQPEFQREIAWKGPEQTRFIDSLIKQLPIPSLCFSYDSQKQQWMVIDGLQRIHTIVRFLDGGDWILSELKDINSNIAGKSVAAIKTSDPNLHKYYTIIENLTIPITVLRCDYSKRNHLEYLFTIFHRLNSTGIKLNNQEIRNCIYAGTFNRLLKELDEYPSWRAINKMKKNDSDRFKKQELILRFLAFSERHKSYSGSMTKFLNDYMHDNRNIDDNKKKYFEDYFRITSDIIYDKLFDRNIKNKLSITLQEAIFIGVGKNIDKFNEQNKSKIKDFYKKLLHHTDFSEEALAEGLAGKIKVISRIDTAILIFSGN